MSIASGWKSCARRRIICVKCAGSCWKKVSRGWVGPDAYAKPQQNSPKEKGGTDKNLAGVSLSLISSVKKDSPGHGPRSAKPTIWWERIPPVTGGYQLLSCISCERETPARRFPVSPARNAKALASCGVTGLGAVLSLSGALRKQHHVVVRWCNAGQLTNGQHDLGPRAGVGRLPQCITQALHCIIIAALTDGKSCHLASGASER